MFYLEHDPFRPVDWRFKRAQWLQEAGRYARRDRDDDYVLLCKRFLAAKQRCKDDLDDEALARKMPGVWYAFKVYGRDDADDRATFEARILADQSPEEIARRQDTTTEVVRWYEKLFFDVRNKLASRDYVCNRVLGPAAHRGVRESDYGLLLKLYALAGGPLAVDALVEMNSRDGANPMSLREMAGFWRADASDTLRRKAALAARCIPVNLGTQVAILEAYHKLVELEKEQQTASDARGLIVQNIQATLQAIPFHVARTDDGPATPRPFDDMAAEPRASELMAVGVGAVSVDGLEQELSTYRFPEVANG